MGDNVEEGSCHNSAADVVDHIPLFLLTSDDQFFSAHPVHVCLREKTERINDQDDEIEQGAQVDGRFAHGTKANEAVKTSAKPAQPAGDEPKSEGDEPKLGLVSN